MKNEKIINDFRLFNENQKKDFIKIAKNIENGASLEKISTQFNDFLNNAHRTNNIFTKGQYKNFAENLLMECLEKNQGTINMINFSLKGDFYNDKLYYDLERIAGGDFREAYDFITNNAIIKVNDDSNSNRKIYKMGIPFRYDGKYYEKEQYISITFPKEIKDDPLNMTPVSAEKIEVLSTKTFTDKGALDSFNSPKLADLKSILEINVLHEPTKYNNAEQIMSKIEDTIKVKFAFSLINNSDLKLSPNLFEQKEDFENILNRAIEKVSLDANVYNTFFSEKKDIVLSKSNKINSNLEKSIECFKDNSNPQYKKIEENFTKIYNNYVELNRKDLIEENYCDYAEYNEYNTLIKELAEATKKSFELEVREKFYAEGGNKDYYDPADD